jgi:radical SAM protein with 4Fe4S-binding SPASM domain
MDRYIIPEALNCNDTLRALKLANYNKACEEHETCATQLESLPSKIILQTTDRCNLTCPICQIPKLQKKLSMPLKIFERVIEELFPTLIELHPTNIGEPLLSPWFNYMCEQMERFGVLLDLTTNGTLLDEERIAKIIPIIRDIKISFDGATKETFEEKRRDAKFDQVYNNIKKLHCALNEYKPSRRVNLALQMTLMRSNYLELPQLIKLAHELGANCVKAYHLFSFNHEMDQESLMHDLSIWPPILEKALELGRVYNIDLQLAEPLLTSTKFPSNLESVNCHLPWHEAWIDYDGKVYTCHSHAGQNAGNILENKFPLIWNSDLYKNIRLGFANNKLDGKCYNCGMNFQKAEEHQAVPYDIQSFLSTGNQQNLSNKTRWSARMRPYDLSGRSK